MNHLVSDSRRRGAPKLRHLLSGARYGDLSPRRRIFRHRSFATRPFGSRVVSYCGLAVVVSCVAGGCTGTWFGFGVIKMEMYRKMIATTAELTTPLTKLRIWSRRLSRFTS